MITGKDRMKVKCFKGTIMRSEYVFSELDKDIRLIMDALKNDNIDITRDPYWKLAFDWGRCEEMAKICRNELE